MAEELSPHELVGKDVRRSRAPADREGAIRHHPVPADSQPEEGSFAVSDFLPIAGFRQTAGVDHDFSGTMHIDLHHMAEVAAAKQLCQAGEMISQPDVVVTAIGHDIAARLLEDNVPVCFAVALSFRKVEVADAWVSARQVGYHIARLGRGAIPDDEKLEIGESLLLDAAKRIADQVSVVMRRNQYRCARLAGSFRQSCHASDVADAFDDQCSLYGRTHRPRPTAQVAEEGRELRLERHVVFERYLDLWRIEIVRRPVPKDQMFVQAARSASRCRRCRPGSLIGD